jgi:hypothetical protein
MFEHPVEFIIHAPQGRRLNRECTVKSMVHLNSGKLRPLPMRMSRVESTLRVRRADRESKSTVTVKPCLEVVSNSRDTPFSSCSKRKSSQPQQKSSKISICNLDVPQQ